MLLWCRRISVRKQKKKTLSGEKLFLRIDHIACFFNSQVLKVYWKLENWGAFESSLTCHSSLSVIPLYDLWCWLQFKLLCPLCVFWHPNKICFNVRKLASTDFTFRRHRPVPPMGRMLPLRTADQLMKMSTWLHSLSVLVCGKSPSTHLICTSSASYLSFIILTPFCCLVSISSCVCWFSLKSRSHEGVLHAIAYLKQAEDSKGYAQWHKVQWEEQCPSVNTGARADVSFH